MYKIEIHTTEENLAELAFLQEIEAEIIGGILVGHIKKRAAAGETRSDNIPAIPGMKRANMKVEVFTSSLENNLLQRLAATESVLDVRVHHCDSIDLYHSPEGLEENHSNGDDPVVMRSLPRTKCIIDPLTTGYLRLRVETDKNPHCLKVIFDTLMTHGVDVQNGRKFRQGDSDFITLTIAQTNATILELVRTEIPAGLAQEALSAKIPATIPHILDDGTFSLGLQGSGTLPAIKITATGRTAAIRAAFHEALCAFNYDISIGRITGNGNTVDDMYYLKALDHNPITQEHLNFLRQRITGENNA